MMSFGAIAASTFVRPLDYVTGAAHAWSLWLLRSAYTGYACKLRRSSDNAMTDVSFFRGQVSGNSSVAAGGDLTTWIGASTNVYIVTLYDQMSNGCDLTQSTSANQPQYNATNYSSKPTVVSASNSYLRATSTILKNINSYSQYARMYTNNGAASNNPILEGGNLTLSGLFTTASNLGRILYRSPYASSGGDNITTSTGVIPSATWFNYTAVRDASAGNQKVWINGGSVATLSSLTQPAWPNTDMTLTMLANGTNLANGCLVGQMFALICFPFALTTEQQTFLQANI